MSDVTQITLVNGHNGYSTTITDKTDMANIIFFVGETIGKPIGNGKGYYEGSFSGVFSFDNDEEFFLRYGDDTVFYIGEGDDDYPIRYRLIHMNIYNDVFPFFSQYDKSGMIWNETN